MLVLGRKAQERIVIGDDIVITVVDIDRGKVRLGIEAPRDTAIYRQELLPAGRPWGPEAWGGFLTPAQAEALGFDLVRLATEARKEGG